MPDPARDPESRPPVTAELPMGPASDAANPGGPPVDPLRTLRLALIAVAALLAVLIAASWIDARKRSQETRLEVARRFQESEQAAAQTAKVADEARDAISDLQTRFGLLEGRLAENWTDMDLLASYTAGREELDGLLARWEVLVAEAQAEADEATAPPAG